jgi:hypothetical protein
VRPRRPVEHVLDLAARNGCEPDPRRRLERAGRGGGRRRELGRPSLRFLGLALERRPPAGCPLDDLFRGGDGRPRRGELALRLALLAPLCDSQRVARRLQPSLRFGQHQRDLLALSRQPLTERGELHCVLADAIDFARETPEHLQALADLRVPLLELAGKVEARIHRCAR